MRLPAGAAAAAILQLAGVQAFGAPGAKGLRFRRAQLLRLRAHFPGRGGIRVGVLVHRQHRAGVEFGRCCTCERQLCRAALQPGLQDGASLTGLASAGLSLVSVE
jgi:hypothetical protein